MGPRSDNRGYGSRDAVNGVGQMARLQWVHRPITVVMGPADQTVHQREQASMGPRSDNRGYGATWTRNSPMRGKSAASMGPRSDNRGYATDALYAPLRCRERASMGPRSDNRGYGLADRKGAWTSRCFNGSTVR